MDLEEVFGGGELSRALEWAETFGDSKELWSILSIRALQLRA